MLASNFWRQFRPRDSLEWLRRVGLFAVFLGFLGSSSAWVFATATGYSGRSPEAPLVEIVACRLGVGGSFKLGLWTPLWVTLKNSGERTKGRVLVTVPDGFGNLCAFEGPEIPLAPGEERELELLVQIGQMFPTVNVRWEDEAGVVAEKLFPPRSLSRATPLHVIPSHERLGLWIGPGDFGPVMRDWARQGNHWQQVSNPRDLPRNWLAYQAFRCVVLSTGENREFVQELIASPDVVAALRRWVEAGGKLVVSVGSEGRSLLEEHGPLAWAVPGPLVGVVTVRKTTGLESMVKSPRPVALRRGDAPLLAQQFEIREGLVEAWEGNIPLLVRRTVGFGTSLIFTLDLTHRALRDWQQWDRLVERLTEGELAEEQATAAQSRALMHYGYTDLAGQLRSALEVLSHVPFMPFAWVVILTVIYLAAIGPLDYWLSGLLSRHRRWTWATFPCLMVLAGGVAWVIASSKGQDIHVKEVTWWDVDVESARIRGNHWANIYSPKPAAYRIRFEPFRAGGGLQTEIHMGWLGIPGYGLGGMESPAHVTFFPDRYFHRQGEELAGFPLAQWATRAVQVQWTEKTSRLPVQSQLMDRDGILRGELRNTSGLTLEDAVIVYGNWAYPVGNLAPGAIWDVGIGEDRRELRSWLNGRQVLVQGEGVRLQTHQQVEPYNQASRDVGYILRMMGFYSAAGGRAYAQLSHEYWPWLDGTDWVLAKRAVLVARLGQQDSPEGSSAADFGVTLFGSSASDREPLPIRRERAIYCRFIIPISPYKATDSSNIAGPR